MMVLVHRNRFGAAAVYLKPDKGGIPRAAYTDMPASHRARATAPVAARGPKASWEQHCALLAGRPRNGEQHWTTEEVPDGMHPHDALNFVRRKDVQDNFS